MSYYLGQMSGTSLDGIDTVLMQFKNGQMQLIAQHHLDFDQPLKTSILAVCDGCENELHHANELANQLSLLYFSSINALLTQAQVSASDIVAAGCHGQTVRHNPPAYTVQLINAALLAENCAVDVVCDFRSRDLAAGGQGAPLVPAFHRALFNSNAQTPQDTFVVNIGGMSNISHLKHNGDTAGHDTGPGNVLMDTWCRLHIKKSYDENGNWATDGEVNQPLLEHLLNEDFFKQPAPKSTGRELFDRAWLNSKLALFNNTDITPVNVMRTLTQLTVESIAREIEKLNSNGQVIICGGGALNQLLMSALQLRLKGFEVLSSSALGHDPQCIEAMAFAWLAQQCIERKAANVPQVTGAKGPRVLGAIYPA